MMMIECLKLSAPARRWKVEARDGSRVFIGTQQHIVYIGKVILNPVKSDDLKADPREIRLNQLPFF